MDSDTKTKIGLSVIGSLLVISIVVTLILVYKKPSDEEKKEGFTLPPIDKQGMKREHMYARRVTEPKTLGGLYEQYTPIRLRSEPKTPRTLLGAWDSELSSKKNYENAQMRGVVEHGYAQRNHKPRNNLMWESELSEVKEYNGLDGSQKFKKGAR